MIVELATEDLTATAGKALTCAVTHPSNLALSLSCVMHTLSLCYFHLTTLFYTHPTCIYHPLLSSCYTHPLALSPPLCYAPPILSPLLCYTHPLTLPPFPLYYVIPTHPLSLSIHTTHHQHNAVLDYTPFSTSISICDPHGAVACRYLVSIDDDLYEQDEIFRTILTTDNETSPLPTTLR